MDHYLNFNKIKGYKKSLNSIWVNEMKQHEYNPSARAPRKFTYRSI